MLITDVSHLKPGDKLVYNLYPKRSEKSNYGIYNVTFINHHYLVCNEGTFEITNSKLTVKGLEMYKLEDAPNHVKVELFKSLYLT